ncbi:hypothetical protein MPTK1_7g00110 [Marchantia polymorpha subsp. ruderalis]|uniref:Uncharacterized protein n=2 Tax=Marchantia polymorpha TaxID=3197 RepID=A0AAF6BUM0_MARPO|nr:hypothetical protein MARPO_0046s0113 [Marchantia polymorpha]BBN15704.1 hypothetical protein Mp_7g00110 [Marchantia polymorpha subsp. ruderalis]|eukprot:PTQ39303.1 hypothetical protein MARPO_0046s0113 [Marchantia polymorpha]
MEIFPGILNRCMFSVDKEVSFSPTIYSDYRTIDLTVRTGKIWTCPLRVLISKSLLLKVIHLLSGPSPCREYLFTWLPTEDCLKKDLLAHVTLPFCLSSSNNVSFYSEVCEYTLHIADCCV